MFAKAQRPVAAQMMTLLIVVIAAVAAGFVAATIGPTGVLAYIGLIAATPILWLSVENLVGLWLVLALADPALPRIGGLSFSDILLILALVKLVLRPGGLPLLPRPVAGILALAWIAEIVLVIFGTAVTPENARFLVTLAGLSAVVYVIWSSPRPNIWITWLAVASATAAFLAIMQYAIYRVTGIVIFPQAQNLFFVRTGISNVFKATGLGIDPNFLGMWMVPGVGIGLIGALRTKHRLRYGGLMLLCAAGILATGSRGALLSIVIGGAIVCLLETSSPRRSVDARILRYIGLLLIAAVVVPLLISVVSQAIARYPVTVHTRTEQIPVVLHDAISGNLTGRGYEAQLPQAISVGKAFLKSENVVHNTLLEALFEAGWLGFLVPLLMILTGLRMALRVIRHAPSEIAMLGAAFILLSINLQTLGAYAFRPFWFLWALLLATGATVPSGSSARSSQISATSRRQSTEQQPSATTTAISSLGKSSAAASYLGSSGPSSIVPPVVSRRKSAPQSAEVESRRGPAGQYSAASQPHRDPAPPSVSHLKPRLSPSSQQPSSEDSTLRSSLVWRGAGIRGVVLIAGKLAVLATTIIATRLLTKTDAGELFVGLAMGAILGSVMAIGLPEAISRGLGRSKGESEVGTFITGALGLWSLAAVIALGGAVLLTIGLGGSFAGSLPLATCALGALVALESILATFMRIRGHALVAELCVSFGSILFAGVFLFVALTYPVSGVGALWLRCSIEICIAVIVAFVTVRPHWHLRQSWSIVSNVRSMVGPTLPLWLTSFSWFVLQNIGILLLALVAGPAAVAYYQPMLKTADTAGGVASMFGPYLLPVAARLRAKGDISQVNSLYVQASRAAFALSVPILALLAFDSHLIAERLFGFSGHGTELVAVVLAIAYLLNAAVGFNGVVLESLASLRTLASRSVIVVTVTTAVNVVLIASFGAIGAAVGTLLSYVAINTLNSTLLYRATRISPFQRHLLSPPFLTLVGVGIALLLSTSTTISLSVAGPVITSALPLILVFAPVVYRLIKTTCKPTSLSANVGAQEAKYGADSAARP